ncbi:MAG: hypothetical protein ABIJ91_00625 [Candidatus Kuenenbacteria bacterium]
MLKGEFVGNVPFIKIILAWADSVQSPFFVLDTGFTGDLQVTSKIAKEPSLKVSGVTRARIANGQEVELPVALATASMEGVSNYVQVLISDSMPLAGISLLSKFFYKATVDCKYKNVILEKVD